MASTINKMMDAIITFMAAHIHIQSCTHSFNISIDALCHFLANGAIVRGTKECIAAEFMNKYSMSCGGENALNMLAMSLSVRTSAMSPKNS